MRGFPPFSSPRASFKRCRSFEHLARGAQPLLRGAAATETRGLAISASYRYRARARCLLPKDVRLQRSVATSRDPHTPVLVTQTGPITRRVAYRIRKGKAINSLRLCRFAVPRMQVLMSRDLTQATPAPTSDKLTTSVASLSLSSTLVFAGLGVATAAPIQAKPRKKLSATKLIRCPMPYRFGFRTVSVIGCVRLLLGISMAFFLFLRPVAKAWTLARCQGAR